MSDKEKYESAIERMSAFLKKYNGSIFSPDGEMYKDLISVIPEIEEQEKVQQQRICKDKINSN